MTRIIKKYKTITGRFLLYSLLVAFTVLLAASCDKEQHKYEGPAQVAFSAATYKFTITPTTGTVMIPIQLIADKRVNAAGNVAVDPASTGAAAVSVPAAFTINPDTFSYDLPVSVDYTKLAAGNSTLILNLTSGLPVAENFKTATITLVKQ